MPRRVTANRRFAAMALAIATAAGATSCATLSASPQNDSSAANEYCAIMSDSVGLYVGNHVTQMGYPIGEVRKIEPSNTDVRVLFTLDETRPLPELVRAVTRSPSILADRSLELVGNYDGGPKLEPAECIPLNRSSTPLSIAKTIGSATDFVNAINPDGSTNVADAMRGLDEAMSGQGPNANQLLTRASGLLDDPDQTISEMGQITRNVAQLTSMLRDNREPLKQILTDLPVTGPAVVRVANGADDLMRPLPEVIQLVNDLELELGPELQTALYSAGELARISSPHYKAIANVLNPLPRFISGINGEPPGASEGALAKHLNNHLFNLLPWRPPLFRIPTPDGLFACGAMNASAPGSCADVAGQPYAVDVALLQYVLTEAQR